MCLIHYIPPSRLLSSFRFCINSKGVNKHYVDHMYKVTKVIF